MQKLLQETKEELFTFVEQRDDLMLLTSCSDSGQNIFLQLVRDLDRSSGSDAVLVFLDDFTLAGPYVSVLIERLSQQHTLANDGAREEQLEPLAPIPESLFDEQRDPVARLKEVIRYSAGLLPRQGDHRLVLVLFPQKINNRTGWLALLEQLAPSTRTVSGWMRRVRLVCRDEAGATVPTWADHARVHPFPVKLAQEDLEAAMETETHDETLPDDQRFQSLLSLAMIDGAHKRTDAALAKYNILRGYYQQEEKAEMEALTLVGMGDAYRRNEQLQMARDHYECAVEKSVAAESWIVFYSALKNLADVSYEQGDYAFAETCYDHGVQLATKLLDAEGRAQMLEGRGLSQEKQQNPQQAAGSFETAATFCANVDMAPLQAANLAHLARVSSQLDDPQLIERVQVAQQELAREEQE